MRNSVLVLLVGTACTAASNKVTQPVRQWSTCSLAAVKEIHVDFPHARQALAEFEQELGHPYSLLYVDLRAGASAASNRCIRLVQLAHQQFAYYDYQGLQVHRATLADSTWAPLLARLGQGHFMGTCTAYATEPREGIWLVKRDSATVFSLAISLNERGDFTGPDKVRVEAATKLTRQLLSRKD